MRFQVRRTSLYGDDESPCEGAERGTLVCVDSRTFKSPEEHDAKFPGRGGWFGAGTNHRLTPTGIARDNGTEPAWFVEFADLDALMAFFAKHGRIIIQTSWTDNATPCVEICDDYRE